MSGELHSSKFLEVLDTDATIKKRSSLESFEFTLSGDGDVEVMNVSHEEPEEHTYTVHVGGEIASDCTCLAFDHQDATCKHMVAITIHKPILEAVSAVPMKMDGGSTGEKTGDDHSDRRPDDSEFIETSRLHVFIYRNEGGIDTRIPIQRMPRYLIYK